MLPNPLFWDATASGDAFFEDVLYETQNSIDAALTSHGRCAPRRAQRFLGGGDWLINSEIGTLEQVLGHNNSIFRSF